jgi:DNA topoisomerase-1
MKYSTLTREELEKSYSEALPKLDFALIEAGRTRHEVDWLYGINLSRALTMAARNWSGRYTTLSTGRVQGPTLKLIVARERAIRTFVPTPFWSIKAEVEIAGSIFEAEYEKKTIETRREADAIVGACRGKNGRIDNVDVKKIQLMPPAPFDLGALQSEAYGLFGYRPIHTSQIAQRLYLDALISYPRTSSQKLPPAIDYRSILKNLCRDPGHRKLAAELLSKPVLKPSEGTKEDSAHPAIYPTGNMPQRVLNKAEKNIWNLIVRRFMAVFGEPALRQSLEISINANGHYFYLKGRQTLKEGWLRFYKPSLRSEEVLVPLVDKGQTIKIKRVVLEDKATEPPSRYNPGNLLRKMEEVEIGTKATRATIIQKLYDREYVRDERMIATDLGFEVLETLEKYCPTVVSTSLTRELEQKMNKIRTNDEKRENVLLEAIEILKPALDKLKDKEKVIGEQLGVASKRAQLEKRTIGVCPICCKGMLVILYSRKTGKRFVGCTDYFKGLCKTSFPLPQKGTARPLRRDCRRCGWPTVQVRMKGRRSWTLCFNPDCPSKDEWRKKSELQSVQ